MDQARDLNIAAAMLFNILLSAVYGVIFFVKSTESEVFRFNTRLGSVGSSTLLLPGAVRQIEAVESF
jgi:hypothetical protein